MATRLRLRQVGVSAALVARQQQTTTTTTTTTVVVVIAVNTAIRLGVDRREPTPASAEGFPLALPSRRLHVQIMTATRKTTAGTVSGSHPQREGRGVDRRCGGNKDAGGPLHGEISEREGPANHRRTPHAPPRASTPPPTPPLPAPSPRLPLCHLVAGGTRAAASASAAPDLARGDNESSLRLPNRGGGGGGGANGVGSPDPTPRNHRTDRHHPPSRLCSTVPVTTSGKTSHVVTNATRVLHTLAGGGGGGPSETITTRGERRVEEEAEAEVAGEG